MAAPLKKHDTQENLCTQTTYWELGVEILRKENSTQPSKTQTFLNPKMRTNRELVLLALSVAIKGQNDGVISCLDAFSASGIQALLWKKQFGSKVKVTANDMNPEAVGSIRENCSLNGFQLQQHQEESPSENTIESSCKNSNILLHERPFQFIHLDPFGTAVGFLDAAFSNLPNKGILSVTSTDISAFLGKCPQVTLRHYNGHVTKCEYLPELACRLIVASLVRETGSTWDERKCQPDQRERLRSDKDTQDEHSSGDQLGCNHQVLAAQWEQEIKLMRSKQMPPKATVSPENPLVGGYFAPFSYWRCSRAAARCNKGLEVLFIFAKEHFVLTVVRVRRGTKKSDESLRKVQRLLHCNLCEERKFVKDTLFAEDNLYSQLTCSCYQNQPGKTASVLGPVWSGSIFSESFVKQMKISVSEIPGISVEVKNIVERMEKEAGICQRNFAGNESNNSCESIFKMGKRSGDFQGPSGKVLKTEKGRAQVLGGEQGSNGREDVTMGSSGEDVAKDDGIDGKREKSEEHLNANVGSRERTKSLCDSDELQEKDGTESEKIKAKCSEDFKFLTESEGTTWAQAGKATTTVVTGKFEKGEKVLNVETNFGCVPFYFTVIRHCQDKGHWPRMKAVVDALIKGGHEASLTIFHQHGVRTTATLEQYKQMLATCSSNS